MRKQKPKGHLSLSMGDFKVYTQGTMNDVTIDGSTGVVRVNGEAIPADQQARGWIDLDADGNLVEEQA